MLVSLLLAVIPLVLCHWVVVVVVAAVAVVVVIQSLEMLPWLLLTWQPCLPYFNHLLYCLHFMHGLLYICEVYLC